jgi:AcrR family transcriptional regulator
MFVVYGRVMTTAIPGTKRHRAEHLGPHRRRPQILDAALEITAEHGVGAVTVGAIAERLNVTRPVIYSCFAHRVEVIASLLQRETGRLADAVVDSLHAARGDTPEVAFVTGFQSLLNVVQERPRSWRFLFFAAPDPAVASRFTRVRAQLCEAVAARLRPALTTWWSMTDAAADNALPVLVEHVMSSCEAAVRSLLDEAGTWSADELAELYGRMVYRALSVAAEPEPISTSHPPSTKTSVVQ